MTERFVSPMAEPNEREREAAYLLIEESAEVIEAALILSASRLQKRATKLLRFGVDEIQPGQPDGNAHRLGLEVGDLLEVIDLAKHAGIITEQSIADGRRAKRKQLAKYLQTIPANAPATRETLLQLGLALDVIEVASDIVAGVLLQEYEAHDGLERFAARVVQAIQESDKVRIVAA